MGNKIRLLIICIIIMIIYAIPFEIVNLQNLSPSLLDEYTTIHRSGGFHVTPPTDYQPNQMIDELYATAFPTLYQVLQPFLTYFGLWDDHHRSTHGKDGNHPPFFSNNGRELFNDPNIIQIPMSIHPSTSFMPILSPFSSLHVVLSSYAPFEVIVSEKFTPEFVTNVKVLQCQTFTPIPVSSRKSSDEQTSNHRHPHHHHHHRHPYQETNTHHQTQISYTDGIRNDTLTINDRDDDHPPQYDDSFPFHHHTMDTPTHRYDKWVDQLNDEASGMLPYQCTIEVSLYGYFSPLSRLFVGVRSLPNTSTTHALYRSKHSVSTLVGSVHDSILAQAGQVKGWFSSLWNRGNEQSMQTEDVSPVQDTVPMTKDSYNANMDMNDSISPFSPSPSPSPSSSSSPSPSISGRSLFTPIDIIQQSIHSTDISHFSVFVTFKRSFSIESAVFCMITLAVFFYLPIIMKRRWMYISLGAFLGVFSVLILFSLLAFRLIPMRKTAVSFALLLNYFVPIPTLLLNYTIYIIREKPAEFFVLTLFGAIFGAIVTYCTKPDQQVEFTSLTIFFSRVFCVFVLFSLSDNFIFILLVLPMVFAISMSPSQWLWQGKQHRDGDDRQLRSHHHNLPRDSIPTPIESPSTPYMPHHRHDDSLFQNQQRQQQRQPYYPHSKAPQYRTPIHRQPYHHDHDDDDNRHTSPSNTSHCHQPYRHHHQYARESRQHTPRRYRSYHNDDESDKGDKGGKYIPKPQPAMDFEYKIDQEQARREKARKAQQQRQQQQTHGGDQQPKHRQNFISPLLNLDSDGGNNNHNHNDDDDDGDDDDDVHVTRYYRKPSTPSRQRAFQPSPISPLSPQLTRPSSHILPIENNPRSVPPQLSSVVQPQSQSLQRQRTQQQPQRRSYNTRNRDKVVLDSEEDENDKT